MTTPLSFASFDPTSSAQTASAAVIDDVFGSAGRIIDRVTHVVTVEGPKDPRGTQHFFHQLEDLLDGVVGTAFTSQGRDRLLTKQPLAHGGSNGTPALGASEPTDQEKFVKTLVDQLATKSSDKQNAIAALFRQALDGKLDDVTGLRSQLSDAQRDLTGYKPLESLKDALEKVPARDKSSRLKAAEDALTGTIPQASGVSQIEHKKVVDELTAAKQKIKALEDNPSTLAKIKGKFRPSKLGTKDVYVLDVSKLDEEDLKALEIEKK